MSTRSATDRLIVFALVALAALLLLPALFVGFGMVGGGMMGGPWGGMWGANAAPGWGYVVWSLAPLLVLAFLFVGGYLLYRGVTKPERERDPAVAELRAAYARGDVDDEEFDRRLSRLRDRE
ncbi:SHOCT domain-containing protein [Halobaculum limi]|uniref:SHOCT domain-containing protein n=1 Tax=Halobaculum limi TaxID=3031916 RepID=UPI0024068D0B|nr:SHOCT domain-containing protein [Halobaculum sp. YSMS11]